KNSGQRPLNQVRWTPSTKSGRCPLTTERPHITVKADVERLLTAPLLGPKVSVSGHVYDIATGHVTTTVDARYPQPPGQLPVTDPGLNQVRRRCLLLPRLPALAAANRTCGR